jgi:hypothetical protein
VELIEEISKISSLSKYPGLLAMVIECECEGSNPYCCLMFMLTMYKDSFEGRKEEGNTRRGDKGGLLFVRASSVISTGVRYSVWRPGASSGDCTTLALTKGRPSCPPCDLGLLINVPVFPSPFSALNCRSTIARRPFYCS